MRCEHNLWWLSACASPSAVLADSLLNSVTLVMEKFTTTKFDWKTDVSCVCMSRAGMSSVDAINANTYTCVCRDPRDEAFQVNPSPFHST